MDKIVLCSLQKVFIHPRLNLAHILHTYPYSSISFLKLVTISKVCYSYLKNYLLILSYFSKNIYISF